METQRSALILFSTTNHHVHLLIGVNRGSLTTIGGRRQERESELDCLIREVKEETKKIIDYTMCHELLSMAIIKRYNSCYYAFLETDLPNLLEIREEFSKTTALEPECNELSSLEVVELDKFVEELIVGSSKPANGFLCRAELKMMMLDVGFDIMKKRRVGNNSPINYFSSQMSVKVDLYCPVAEVPLIISVFPFNKNLPRVYGVILMNGCYISDQFFFEEPDRILYRSGWLTKSHL